MASLTGNFRTGLPIDEAIVACAEAIEGLGWRIDAVEANRIVSHPDSGSHPLRVEVTLAESEQATDVRIIGTDDAADPAPREALVAELNRLRNAIGTSLDGATAAQPGANAAQPRDQSANVRRERIAIGAIIGLCALGLAIIATALLHNSSQSPNTKRHPGKSNSSAASKRKASRQTDGQKSAGSQAQAPTASSAAGPTSTAGGPAPSLPGLGDAQNVRDGDQRFTLTPVRVGRTGSFITLDVKIAALGGRGYDGTGRAFLGTLIGSDGKRYEVEGSRGPASCELPAVKLTSGETRTGCVPFKVPSGVDAATFRYEPFFIGNHSVEWNLSG